MEDTSFRRFQWQLGRIQYVTEMECMHDGVIKEISI